MHAWLSPYYQQFTSALQQQRLGNSLIIAGHEGLGGKELALAMATYYLCHHPTPIGPCGHCTSCQAFARLTNPDLKVAYTSTADEADSEQDFSYDCSGLIIRGPEPKTRRVLRIDTMRKITTFLNESAVGGGRGKVVIIEGAETMTEGAANAILKTFEEPAPHSLIIMLTQSLEALLPTILSRASKVVLKDVPLAESLAYLLDPKEQHPPVIKRLYEDYYAESAEEIDCPGLATPITQERAEIALALNSYAPLAAMTMLLQGTDITALAVVRALIKSIDPHAAGSTPPGNTKSAPNGVSNGAYQAGGNGRSGNANYGRTGNAGGNGGSNARFNRGGRGGYGNNGGAARPLYHDGSGEVIRALRALSKPLQAKLLSELILEILKYKAYVSEQELPLIKHSQGSALARLQADHLFAAQTQLRYIEERAPLIPARAPLALLRAWIQAFRADLAPV